MIQLYSHQQSYLIRRTYPLESSKCFRVFYPHHPPCPVRDTPDRSQPAFSKQFTDSWSNSCPPHCLSIAGIGLNQINSCISLIQRGRTVTRERKVIACLSPTKTPFPVLQMSNQIQFSPSIYVTQTDLFETRHNGRTFQHRPSNFPNFIVSPIMKHAKNSNCITKPPKPFQWWV